MRTDAGEIASGRSFTLGDLVALVAGAALALAVHRGSFSVSGLRWGPLAVPDWFQAILSLSMILPEVCLALGPMILLRRARFGGAIRPAEFLALSVGWSTLLIHLQYSPVLGFMKADGIGKGSYRREEIAFFAWRFLGALLLISAALIVWKARRRVPAWWAGLLLVILWHGLAENLAQGSQWGLYAMFEQIKVGPTLRSIVYFVAMLPSGTLQTLPLAAAFHDLPRINRSRSRIEGLYLALAAAPWLIYETYSMLFEIMPMWASTGPTNAMVLGILASTRPTIGLLFGLLIVHRFGPAWSRWLDGGRHE